MSCAISFLPWSGNGGTNSGLVMLRLSSLWLEGPRHVAPIEPMARGARCISDLWRDVPKKIDLWDTCWWVGGVF